MLEFEILVQGLFRPDQLHITYNPTLQMPHTSATSTWMNNLWEEKLIQARKKNTLLYDTPLFRFVSVHKENNGTMSLLIGNTSYKEYVTTRQPEFANYHPRHELGNALSVCSVVETSDNVILLEQRQGVDVYVGRYHVIGGFFERHLDGGNTPDPFASMRREIREETGIQESDIKEQYCLGAVYDLTTPHAELCFLTRLHIPIAEVRTRQPEDNEIAHLQTLEITAESLRSFILTHHGNISATGEPNLLLYGNWKFGQDWFDNILSGLKH